MDEHVRRHGPPQDDGLLEGAAGVHLVQQTVTGHTPPVSGWDTCLLLG
jgi:hypothetical protein